MLSGEVCSLYFKEGGKLILLFHHVRIFKDKKAFVNLDGSLL